MDDYVRTADLIVTGQITKIDKVHNFYGYQSNAAEREKHEAALIAKGKKPVFSFAVPMVDFIVSVDEVIKPDAGVKTPKPESVVYRKHMKADAIFSPTTAKNIAGKYVFFFNRNPDNKTYGLMSASRKVKVNELGVASVYLLDLEERKVLDGKFDEKDFLQQIRDQVSKRFLMHPQEILAQQ